MPLARIKRFLVPQDNIFFDLMLKQAETAHIASQSLVELFADYSNVEKRSERIKELEHEGDKLMRDVYTALNKTFIVPIDHSDISTLATALDDITDLIDNVSILLVAYGIKEPTPPMVHLAEVLVNQTKELKNAVASISHSKNYHKVNDHCKNIKQMENKADEAYIKAITALFKKNEPLEIIKEKEILDCLESATDKVDNAAQHISDIVMKHS
ncbi:DUF47 family protein [Candidatus Micrarchaeota archaeon]|nr:DUF47 family protein [Candidatus Micrarchaeota archaeon]